MAIAQVQFTSQESKMADNEVKIGLLLLLSHRNRRRRLLMQRQTQRKPRKVSIRDIFTRRKAQGDYYNLVQELKLRDIEFYFAVQTRIIVDRFRQLFVHLRRHVFSWQILTEQAWILFLCIPLTRKLCMLTLMLMYARFTLKYSQHKHKCKRKEFSCQRNTQK